MNFFYLVCNKCEKCTEKEVLLHNNKKSSKNSLINKKVEIPKDEIISNDDSTNNLEIIDYPYAINFNQDFMSNLSQNNYNLKQPQSNFYINKVNKIKNLPTDQLDNSNIKSNSKKNSLSSSSLIVNNEDNFLQNKVLLTNYYVNYENIKKKEIQKKIIPYKKINNEKNNNLCKKNERINTKIGEKRDVIGKRIAESFSAKKNNKSNSQILNMKNNNKEIKIIKTELGDYQKIKKSKTNFIMRNRSNKTRKNIILKNKNNLIKELFLKQNIYITYNKNNNHKNPLSKLNKVKKGSHNTKQNYSKYKKSLNKFNKKNLLYYPKVKFNDSSNNNSHSLANKMSFNNYRNTATTNATNYRGSKTNNLNFSYLWLNNKDSHYLSKSYINPFDKFENKRIKNIHNLNIVTS